MASSSTNLFERSLGDLSKPIHRIFRRSNFDLQDHEYDLMRPGLQLASRLISPPTPISFWHTIMKRDVREIKYPLHPLGENVVHYEFFDSPATLTAPQVREVEAALIRIADITRFAVDEDDELSPWCMETCLSEDGSLVSTIKIPRAAFREMQKAADKSTNNNDEDYSIVTSFMLARTLVHELAHVVYHLYYGDDEFYYLPGQAVDEVGFTWEDQVFGGLVNYKVFYRDNLVPSYHAVIHPWPNAHMISKYLQTGDRIGIRFQHSIALLSCLSMTTATPTSSRMVVAAYPFRIFRDCSPRRSGLGT